MNEYQTNQKTQTGETLQTSSVIANAPLEPGRRRYLVVVRAGSSSLHPGWLKGQANRNWDLLIYAYGENVPWQNGEGIEVVHANGPKWPPLHALYQERKGLILSYDYICFPDDDLAANVETINAIFVISQHFGLELSQPALTHDSCMHCWGITMENRSFLLRYTNFVEAMAPVFSRSFLERCAPTFNENISGYGIDLLWSSWVSNPLKIGILDVCPVKHTRPTKSGAYYNKIFSMGANPDEELIALIKKYRLVPEQAQIPGQVVMPQARILGGILRDQSRITLQEGHGTELIRSLVNGFPEEMGKNQRQVVNMLFPIMQQMISIT